MYVCTAVSTRLGLYEPYPARHDASEVIGHSWQTAVGCGSRPAPRPAPWQREHVRCLLALVMIACAHDMNARFGGSLGSEGPGAEVAAGVGIGYAANFE